MKKTNKILSLVIVLISLFLLTSCISATSTLQFVSLPKSEYELSNNSDDNTIDDDVIIQIDGKEYILSDAIKQGAIVTGNTFNAEGNYTLVVKYGTATISYSYHVGNSQDIPEPSTEHINSYSNVNVKTACEGFENGLISLVELMDYLDYSNYAKSTEVSTKLNIQPAGQYRITNTATNNNGFLYSGLIKLTQDIDIKTNEGWSTALGFVVDNGQALTIDLNGYALSQTGNCTGRAGYALFKVCDGGTLNVIDSSENKSGKISGNLCAIQGYAGSTINIFGGTIDCDSKVSEHDYITNCNWYDKNLGKVSIYLGGEGAALNIYGGSIISTNTVTCGYGTTSSYVNQSKELEGYAVLFENGAIINKIGGSIIGRNCLPIK